MIKGIKILALLAIVSSLLWAVPAFAGKATLNEDDMDGITAAGEPKIIDAISSTGANVITFNEAVSVSPNGWGQGGQNSLKALILNNVVGEQSIATALNIATTSQGIRGASQTNSIDQSWGATEDFTGPGETTNTNAASASSQGSIQGTSTDGSAKTYSGACVFGSCITGGNGSVTQNVRMSAYADLIIDAIAPNSTNTITVTQNNNYDLNLGAGAPGGSFQKGLAALVVNNALGMNLIANGWNILGGTVGTATNGAAINAAPAVPLFNDSYTQANTSNQYRGAPIGWNTRTP